MRLHFIKSDNDISVKIHSDGHDSPFNYLDFIQKIIKGEEIEEPTFDREIEESDKNKIIEMLQKIKEVLENKEEEKKYEEE